MNSKRRAELQRRLSMGAVPRPPAGLAERIKADIPKYLDAGPVPQRFAWGTAMRVAATLVTLLTTALVTMELLEPNEKAAVQRSARFEKVTPAVLRYGAQQQPAQTASIPQAETEVSLDIAQGFAAPAALAPSQEMRAEAANATAGQVTATEAAPMQMADAATGAPAPAATPAAPPAPPMMAAPASARVGGAERPSEAEEQITVQAAAPSLVPQESARSLQLEQPDVFGISLDPDAFPAIRTAIGSGTRPAPDSVDVEALVNYFAGAQSARRDVALEVEVSPAPIAAEGDVALLRFTVDTAKMVVPVRASVPPVARDAHLHIDIDTNAVASFRRIGDSGTEESEEALLYNTSVTGLYELKLKPNLRSSQRIATVRLQYVSVTNGRKQTLTHVIRGGDLAETWDRASRRHRLAALGAVWSETLRGPKGGVEIAQRAEELATQNPQDARARELAAAATLSTGGER
jgi:hypothetical protein